jgi:hypothetical protein
MLLCSGENKCGVDCVKLFLKALCTAKSSSIFWAITPRICWKSADVPLPSSEFALPTARFHSGFSFGLWRKYIPQKLQLSLNGPRGATYRYCGKLFAGEPQVSWPNHNLSGRRGRWTAPSVSRLRGAPVCGLFSAHRPRLPPETYDGDMSEANQYSHLLSPGKLLIPRWWHSDSVLSVLAEMVCASIQVSVATDCRVKFRCLRRCSCSICSYWLKWILSFGNARLASFCVSDCHCG